MKEKRERWGVRDDRYPAITLFLMAKKFGKIWWYNLTEAWKLEKIAIKEVK
jgi:hypothetical protein